MTLLCQVYASHHHTLLPSELLRGRVGTSGLLPPESRRGLSVSIQSFYVPLAGASCVGIGSWELVIVPLWKLWCTTCWLSV